MYTLEIARFQTRCTRTIQRFYSLDAIRTEYDNAVYALYFEGVRAKIRMKCDGKLIQSAYLKGV